MLALTALLACSGKSSETRVDLAAYLAHAKTWAPADAEAARTIKRIFDTQFVNQPEVLHQIDDSRPRVLEHIAQLRAYSPRSEEVQHVHGRYVAAWQDLLDGYDLIQKGFSTGDYTNLARGREGLDAWRQGIVEVAEELRGLMEHFGVESDGAISARLSPPGQSTTHSTKSSARPAAIA